MPLPLGLLVVEEKMRSSGCFQRWLATCNRNGIQPLNCTKTVSNYIFSLHATSAFPFWYPRRTLWGGVQVDIKCFGLPSDDAQIWNMWKWRVKGKWLSQAKDNMQRDTVVDKISEVSIYIMKIYWFTWFIVNEKD